MVVHENYIFDIEQQYQKYILSSVFYAEIHK